MITEQDREQIRERYDAQHWVEAERALTVRRQHQQWLDSLTAMPFEEKLTLARSLKDWGLTNNDWIHVEATKNIINQDGAFTLRADIEQWCRDRNIPWRMESVYFAQGDFERPEFGMASDDFCWKPTAEVCAVAFDTEEDALEFKLRWS